MDAIPQETLSRLRDVMEPLEAAAKGFQAIRFREGDLIELPECGLVLEFATHNGRRELRVPKSAGAKVRKKLAE